MLQMSIFDDDDRRMAEIDDRCKDYRRLGSFFKPWYWDIKGINTESQGKTLIEYFDLDKLKELYENINWIKYNNFISRYDEVRDRHLFAHYLSHIVLNAYIVNDINYENIKTHRKFRKDEFTYKLDETNAVLKDIVAYCCDPEISEGIRTKLYISQNEFTGTFALHFGIYHSGFDPIYIKFDELNKK